MSNAVIIALPAMIMGGMVVLICAWFWRESRDLRAGSLEAPAFIARKYRKPGDPYLFGLENYFVTAQFTDMQGEARTAEIRVPSQQWHWLREGATESIIYLPANPRRARVISRAGQTGVAILMLFGMSTGGIMVLIAIAILALWTVPSQTAVPAPPPTKFDKSGVDRVFMTVSPQHDRVAVIDENGSGLRIRTIPAGGLVASVRGRNWRLLSWSPDGMRLAIAEGQAAIVLDAATLHPVPGTAYSWDRPAPALASCEGLPVWDPAGTRAVAPCGNRIMMLAPAGVRMLQGPTDRVLGVAWSPGGRRLAAVSEDNYVRAYDPDTQQCVAVSEDYPYPRAIYFADERTVVVIDVALRQYTFRL